MAPLGLPLTNHKFTLNAWGVAGIFGGEEALLVMALIPFCKRRRWFGWYNAPGSLNVARRFGNIAPSRLWEPIFHHTSKSPAALFDFDGAMGPRYKGALSGTDMQTGHLGYLAIERCKEDKGEVVIEGREKEHARVAFIDMRNINLNQNMPPLSGFSPFLALIPIAISIATCVMCALVYDWYSFSAILFGILAGGLSSIALGSGDLALLSLNKPAEGVPAADGVLTPVIGGDIVAVVKGTECTLNVITKATFELKFDDGLWGHAIRACSLLLIAEFLSQLLLVPQGTLFGQLMFVISLCVSWAYNFRIASYKKEELQGNILFNRLGNPPIRRFRLKTRTAMTVFTALLVFHEVENPSPAYIEKMLCTFIPNDTIAWSRWRERVSRQMRDNSKSYLELGEHDDRDLTVDERKLLGIRLGDASAAYKGYLEHFGQGTTQSTPKQQSDSEHC